MVTVVFASNDNHAMLLGVALCSLFENKKGDYPVDVFVMDDGISAASKERLAVLERKYNFSITYLVPDRALFKSVPIRDRPLAAYYRTTIARFLPATCHRVIYLDCDIIIRGDIAELFNVNLGGKAIAAVSDFYDDAWREYRREITREKDGVYFNSGVLLIDMDIWRSIDAEHQLFNFISAHPEKLIFDDQDPLNFIFAGNYKALPGKYNVMVGAPKKTDDGPDPLIAHFSGGAKPWYFLSALRYQPEWVHYANLTPWRGQKYRKVMDIYFAKKYHIYPVAWGVWGIYKKAKQLL